MTRILTCRTIYLLTIGLWLKAGFLFGQGTYPQSVNLSPVSPNIASLYKAFEHPVGTYTGLPGISIPLVSLKSKDIKATFSLGYGGGGIKVEEIAGDVGLGWSINGAGSITRIVRGLPDDTPNNGQKTGGYYHSDFKPLDYANEIFNEFTDNRLKRNLLDLEPDLYMYSFHGRSGTFFFDGNKNVIQQEQSGLKISPVLDNPQVGNFIGWKITDEMGNNFYFGVSPFNSRIAREVTETSFSGNETPTMSNSLPIFNSTWHLLDVSDINNKKHMSYNYTFNQIAYFTKGSEYRQFISSGLCNSYTGTSAYNAYVSVGEYKLDEVLYEKGSIKFTYGDRTDLLGGKKLTMVEHLDQQNNVTQRFRLNYDYFITSHSPRPGDEVNKRLKLISVSEKTNNLDSISFRFDYNTNVALPDRLSTSVDYWGYYNGKSNGYSMLPNGEYLHNEPIRFTEGADRRADAFYASANILQKITFPTGAERRFEWEGNIFLRDGDSEMQVGGENLVPKGIYLDHNDPINIPFNGYREQITVSNLSGGALVKYSILGNVAFNCDFHFRIINKSTNAQVNFLNDHILDAEIYLNNGDYELQLDYNYPCSIDIVQLWWEEESGTIEVINRHGKDFLKKNEFGGGLRIKKIVDYDPITNKEEAADYSYNFIADPSITSGLLISSMKFFKINTCTGNNCYSAGLYSTSNYPLSNQEGAYIYYTDVTVKRSGNGRVEKLFDFAVDGDTTYSYNLHQTPILPNENRSYKRGNLLVEKIFNEGGDLLKQVQIEYNYLDEYQTNNYYRATLAYKVVAQPDTLPFTPFYQKVCVRPYYLHSRFKYLKSVTETEYNGGMPIENKKEFTYDLAAAALFPKEEIHEINGTNKKRKRFRYASDNDFHAMYTPSDYLVIASLHALNYQQALEEVEQREKNNQLFFLGGQSSYFGLDTFGNLRLLKSLSHLSSTDFVQQNFEAYDLKGNLLSYSREGSVKNVYLYSYNRAYLIAEIKNADYSTVVSVLGGQLAVDNFSESIPTDVQVDHLIMLLRNSSLLKDAQITTYTYKPLIGVTSITDPKRMTIYYEYDDFGRLKLEKDQYGNIIKNHNYHYKP